MQTTERNFGDVFFPFSFHEYADHYYRRLLWPRLLCICFCFLAATQAVFLLCARLLRPKISLPECMTVQPRSTDTDSSGLLIFGGLNRQGIRKHEICNVAPQLDRLSYTLGRTRPSPLRSPSTRAWLWCRTTAPLLTMPADPSDFGPEDEHSLRLVMEITHGNVRGAEKQLDAGGAVHLLTTKLFVLPECNHAMFV